MIVVFSTALITWIIPHNSGSEFKFEEGKPWQHEDFTAPFNFHVIKSEATLKQERDTAMKAYEPYFAFDKEKGRAQVERFRNAYADGIPNIYKTIAGSDTITAYAGKMLAELIATQMDSMYARGIMDEAAYDTLTISGEQKVRIIEDRVARSRSPRDFITAKIALKRIYTHKEIAPYHEQLLPYGIDNYIVSNIVYDQTRSEQALTDIIASVPQVIGEIQKGQKVISRGQIVDKDAYLALTSYTKDNAHQKLNDSQNIQNICGNAIFVLILITCLTIYLSLFRHDYFDEARHIAMVYVLILAFSLATAIVVSHNVEYTYLVPYAILPIFIRVFLDSRTAFVSHVVTVLCCALMIEYPFEFIVTQVVAGMCAIYSLRQLQNRAQLFKTAVAIVIVSALIFLAFDLTRTASLEQINVQHYNYILINGVILLIAYPLLYLIEKVFGYTSDITLIELSNTNNELLRRLAEVAPGTFQHSIQVGNLAAEIANRIGANAQLVRTGALYHDIGKLENPVFFTENQSGINPHEQLSYVESAQIIVSHVTDGLKLAAKYNLPTVIRNFIATHHGYGKAKYFAMKYKAEHPDEQVDDLLFSYPGPNPSTPEQAILMMTDAVEAASRSLPEYTEQAIRDLVDRIIDGQVADRFFHECPITFRDIAYTKTILVEKLKTIYHTRISYPKG